ncbi:MAG: MFS transporter [Christensenellales bacterium]|jgi:sugar (glycoside-pentoside-hexuronide) transporter
MRNNEVANNGNDKLTRRNLLMYSLGTFGRDFVYVLFTVQLLNYILFTKQITKSHFGAITFIIIAARIFDAFNDPIMGGIVDNTRTKWGKFKPWQLSGAILTGGVIITTFSNELQGGSFVLLFGIMYFMFSITYTMNDISYWGMMPSLTSNEHDRSKLMSAAQFVASIGGGLVGIIVPVITIGDLAIQGSAVTGYRVISVFAVIIMIGFQLFTVLGVKETKIPPLKQEDRITLKRIFVKVAGNDQLLWSALIMVIFSVGTGVVGGGLITAYIFFEFGYNGLLLTFFFVLFGAANILFTVTYPWLEKKFTRTKMLYSTGFAIIGGYLLMMLLGLVIPTAPQNTALWYIKFGSMMLANGIAGYGHGFYMIMVIAMANTVEYNEYKTGKREEALIFSLRPFTAKFSGALMQGVVTIVYLIAGVLNYTNRISALENDAARGIITSEDKLFRIEAIINSVPTAAKNILLVNMCVIPAVFMCVAMLIYKKKYILNEKTYAEILTEIESRKGVIN